MKKHPFTITFILAFMSTHLLVCVNATTQASPESYWRHSSDFARFHIVIPTDASPMLQKAGKEFQRLWKACTHRPITKSFINEGMTNIWLGTRTIPDDLFPADELERFHTEEYVVQTYTPTQRAAEKGAQKQLIIAGGSEFAVLYGMYAFFSQEVGVSFLEPALTYTPHVPGGINEISLRGVPDFSVREIGLLSRFTEGVQEYRYAHRLTPVAFPEPGCPDYYDALLVESTEGSAEKNTVAYGEESGALALFEEIKMVLAGSGDTEPHGEKWFWKDPINGTTTWLLAAMTHLRPVLSNAGRILNEREETAAAAIIHTAGDLARLLQDAFPDETHRVLVLLPPSFLQPPRELVPHPNVQVMLSTAACDFSRSLSDSSSSCNAPFAGTLEGWRKLGIPVYVYDFLTNMKDPQLPFPCLDTLQSKLLFYIQKQVEGIYFAGLPSEYAGVVDMLSLKLFSASQLMFNPDGDMESIKNLFLRGYYGPASEAVEAYLRMLDADLNASGKPLMITDNGSWITVETLSKADALLRSVLNDTLPDPVRDRISPMLEGIARCHAIRSGTATDKDS